MSASIFLYPVLDRTAFPVLSDLGSFAIGAVGEILLGISIGMAVNLIFVGLQMAGQISGYQMGLALARVMDPSAGEQVPLLAQFFQLFAGAPDERVPGGHAVKNYHRVVIYRFQPAVFVIFFKYDIQKSGQHDFSADESSFLTPNPDKPELTIEDCKLNICGCRSVLYKMDRSTQRLSTGTIH
jgi:hypothetical protein